MGYKNVQSLQGNQCMFKDGDWLILFKLTQAAYEEWKIVCTFSWASFYNHSSCKWGSSWIKAKTHVLCQDIPFLKTRASYEKFRRYKGIDQLLEILNIPCKHWNDNIGWSLVEVMHFFILTSMRLVVQKVIFISVSFNGVTTINNQTWILMRIYIVKGWKWFPILLTLQQVLQGANAKNLMQVIIDALFVYNGLFKFDFIAKFVHFDVDGMTTFEGNKTDIKV